MQRLLGQDGRYRAVRRIDAGGMGEIWEADDTVLGPAGRGQGAGRGAGR
jgi:hypothetical protein